MKQKLFSSVFVLLLLSSLLIIPNALAESDPTFSITTNANQLEINDELEVTIAGSGIDDAFAFEFHLYYDSNILEPNLSSVTSPVQGMSVPAKLYENKSGSPYVLLAHTKFHTNVGESGDVTFFTLTFKALKAGNAELSLGFVKLIDSSIVTTTPIISEKVVISVGDGGTGGSSPITPAASKPVLVITASQLKSTTSRIDISIPDNITEIQLPYNTAELLNGKSLQFSSDAISLSFPSGIFTQLTKQISSSQLTGSTISLFIEPVKNQSTVDDLLAKAKREMDADVSLGSVIYELSLQLETANGEVYTLTAFDYPVTLRLPVSTSIVPSISGIYYFPVENPIVYIGNDISNNWMTIQLNHFSYYAILTVDKKFEDVAGDHWASDVIKELYAKQVVKGINTSSFSPGRNITRAEFTAMIVRTMKLEGKMPVSFDDVSLDDWFASDVSSALAAGIITGKSEQKFDPHAFISRQEMATIVTRAYKLRFGEPEISSTAPTFTDEQQIAEWAVDYVYDAASLGLVQGRAAQLFAPKEHLTRAEAAQVLYNLLKLYE